MKQRFPDQFTEKHIENEPSKILNSYLDVALSNKYLEVIIQFLKLKLFNERD